MHQIFLKIITGILAIILLTVNSSMASSDDKMTPAFSTEEKTAINQMIRDYILNNPEILPEAIRILQSRAKKALLEQHYIRLYEDGYSYVGGNKNGDVTLIEFLDYNCGYCKRALSIVNKLIKEDGNLRVIYKEYPILSESSYTASKAAMASMKQGKYPEFHAALMQNTGDLTDNRIFELARAVGLDEQILAKDMTSPILERNIQINHSLAKAFEIRGTPGYIIGDIIAPGAVPYEELVAMIDQTRRLAQKK